MNDTFRLGQIGGVTVGVHWSVLAIVSLLTWSLASRTLPESAPGYAGGAYWAAAFIGALGLLLAILVHELCHALVARRHGVEVEGITLWMFGGVARLTTQARDAATELRIALAGPAASVVIGTVCFVLAAVSYALGGPELAIAALMWLGVINIILALFNLLPGAPLDGGRVLTAVLWKRSGNERLARVRAARAGRIVGQVLIGVGLLELALIGAVGGVWLALIGWFLTAAARAEEREGEAASALEGISAGDIMTRDLHTVSSAATVEDFVRQDVMRSLVSSFPVIDPDGRVQGLVTLRQVRELPRRAWPTTAVGTIAAPLAQVALARPGEPVLDVVHRGGSAAGRVLVMDGDRLVGIVSPSDVTKAVEHLSLLAETQPRARR
ncbi:MAG TPA: site-2 protease family protein [Acidimicrobiales bacterium]|nr:site-2 protease family protein [Acidimicrobiales bacterium]